MKFRINFLFGIMVSILCLCDAMASTTKTCPAGLFCTSGGEYTFDDKYDIESYMIAPAKLATIGWGNWQNEGLCAKRTGQGFDTICAYFTEDYDEVWVSTWFGFYLVKNGNVTYHAGGTTPARGAFPCPGTHPSSAAGASSVFECYRIVSNGQKEYYKAQKNSQTSSSGNNTDIETVKALVADLQKEVNKNYTNCDLGRIRDLVSELQNALNKSKQENTTNTESVKAMIKAGISDASVKNKDLKLSEKTEAFKTSKMTTGKSMRASGNNRLGGNLEPVMNKSEKTSSNNSVDIDLETAKKMISAGI